MWWAMAAWGSPDGPNLSGTMVPVCVGDRMVTFSASIGDNDGTYYGRTAWFGFPTLHLDDGVWSEALGTGLHMYDADVEQPRFGAAPKVDAIAGPGLTARSTWSDCLPFEALPPSVSFVMGPDGVEVVVGGSRRPLAVDWTHRWLPGHRELGRSEGYAPDGSDPDPALAARVSTAAAFAQDRFVVVAPVCGGCFDAAVVVFEASASAARRAISAAANQTGLDRHRAGEAAAADWFAAAERADPTNATATFNLACAHARAGRSDQALSALSRLPRTPEFDRKLASDPDLGPLRGLTAFAELAARPGPPGSRVVIPPTGPAARDVREAGLVEGLALASSPPTGAAFVLVVGSPATNGAVAAWATRVGATVSAAKVAFAGRTFAGAGRAVIAQVEDDQGRCTVVVATEETQGLRALLGEVQPSCIEGWRVFGREGDAWVPLGASDD